MRYELEVSYDHGCENPNDYDAFQVISFNNRHINFVHPDEIDNADILAPLSYYEHGSCRWMVGESVVPDPYGGFDTVALAGVIVYNEELGGDRAWFDEKTPAERLETLHAVADLYTDWCNGSCFFYTLYELVDCEACGHTDRKYVDSCGGFIGAENFSEHVNHELLYGIDPADVKVTGEAGYAVTLDPIQVSA